MRLLTIASKTFSMSAAVMSADGLCARCMMSAEVFGVAAASVANAIEGARAEMAAAIRNGISVRDDFIT